MRLCQLPEHWQPHRADDLGYQPSPVGISFTTYPSRIELWAGVNTSECEARPTLERNYQKEPDWLSNE